MPAAPPALNRLRRSPRTARRPRPIPRLWVRLTALTLFVIALIIGMVGLTLKAVRPYREAGVEAARLDSTRRQAAALQTRNAVLRRQIAYLKTPEGIAVEAHRLGYMRPGERPLVLLDLVLPDSSSPPMPDAVAPADSSLFARFQSHLRDL